MLFAIALSLVAGTGCTTDLVTGYKPRPLGDSPAARRAYYAGKYTAEARAADQERADEKKGRPPATPGQVGPPTQY